MLLFLIFSSNFLKSLFILYLFNFDMVYLKFPLILFEMFLSLGQFIENFFLILTTNILNFIKITDNVTGVC